MKKFKVRECRRHGELSIAKFYKCSYPGGGYYYKCSICSLQYYKKNKKRLQEYARWYAKRYYRLHRDRVLNAAKALYRKKRLDGTASVYYLKNRKKIIKKQREWQAKHPEYRRNYYLANRESILKKQKKYRERNMGYYRDYMRGYMAGSRKKVGKGR